MPYSVPFRSKQELAANAYAWIRQFAPSLEAPIDIEEIMELQLEIDPFPMPSFEEAFGIVGTLGAGYRILFIDESVYKRQQARYRFTAAHEIAHLVLHRDILDDLSTHWEQSPTKSTEEWIRLYQSTHPVIRTMEFQANYWASHVLAPNPTFLEAANRALLEYEAWYEAERLQGSDPDNSFETVITSLCGQLKRIFLISHEMVRIRLEEERLIETVIES